MAAMGSTLARRALGRQLNVLRMRAKISQAQASRIIGISPQTMGRLEDGQSVRSANDLFMNALCDAYRASETERRMILALAHEVRVAAKHGGGWWRAFADQIPADFDHYLDLETAATRLTAWRLTIVPGLLQTTEYRRSVIWTESPQLPTEAVEKRVELATHRQARLEDPGFTLNVLLSKAVLLDQIGGPGVMESQLLHLVDMMDRPNVSIRVVPFDGRGHLGSVCGSFILLDFAALPFTKLIEPSVVYVETLTGALYLETRTDVEQYKGAVNEIARVALDESESRRLILETARDYGV